MPNPERRPATFTWMAALSRCAPGNETKVAMALRALDAIGALPVKLRDLCMRTGLKERQVRAAIHNLVEHVHIPLGCSVYGVYLCRYPEEYALAQSRLLQVALPALHRVRVLRRLAREYGPPAQLSLLDP